MIRDHHALARRLLFGLLLFPLTLAAARAQTGEPPRRARRVAVTRVQPCAVPRSTTSLGTFNPTPYIMVGGDAPLGGGYSPLEIYGDQTLPLYGPLSALRSSTAPVLTYVRGYDGRTYAAEAASFSSPNLPILSPVRYPTVGNYYYGPRVIRTMPWGTNAINWIDQN